LAGAINPRIETVSRLYDEVHELLKKYATIADNIEIVIIVLPPDVRCLLGIGKRRRTETLGWAGAVISTFVTGLTIYMYASAVQKKGKKALIVFKEVGKFLGEVRGNPSLDEMEFWNKFRVYEGIVRGLPYEKED